MNAAKGAHLMLTTFAAMAVIGCQPPAWSRKSPAPYVSSPVPAPIVKTDPAQAKRVLLVINDASNDSREIGEFYKKQRMIPDENVLTVTMGADEDLHQDDFERDLMVPFRKKVRGSKNPIDFVVLTKGIPIRLKPWGMSLDGYISTALMNLRPIANPTPEEIKRCLNPYFNKAEPFSAKKYGFFLVCRLDGYTKEDAKRLVTNSLNAKPHKGPFLLDADPTRDSGGYAMMQNSLLRAGDVLKAKGFEVEVDKNPEFAPSIKQLAGYASWGSNDRKYNKAAYQALRFLPGAIGETFVSTSGRTFKPVTSGQSVITDLIAGGITGVKGYVGEPYTFALARPDILFDRYTGGHNLAESFYMASLVLKWKDLVIGDPLCNPYAAKK